MQVDPKEGGVILTKAECETSLKVCLNAEILENDKQTKNDKIKAVVSLNDDIHDILRNLLAASSQTNPSGVCNAS